MSSSWRMARRTRSCRPSAFLRRPAPRRLRPISMSGRQPEMPQPSRAASQTPPGWVRPLASVTPQASMRAMASDRPMATGGRVDSRRPSHVDPLTCPRRSRRCAPRARVGLGGAPRRAPQCPGGTEALPSYSCSIPGLTPAWASSLWRTSNAMGRIPITTAVDATPARTTPSICSAGLRFRRLSQLA